DDARPLVGHRGQPIRLVAVGDAQGNVLSQGEWSYDGRVFMGIDTDVVPVPPVQAFRDDRDTLRHVADEADIADGRPPQPREAGAGTFDLRLLRNAAGHAQALVRGIAQQGSVMAAQERRLSTGADMRNAGRDAEIGGIEQWGQGHRPGAYQIIMPGPARPQGSADCAIDKCCVSPDPFAAASTEHPAVSGPRGRTRNVEEM